MANRKVAKTFRCVETGEKYYPGDTYKGKRKDLEHVLVPVKKKATPKKKK